MVFPTADLYRHLLEAHGFHVAAIQLFPRPVPLPGPLSRWMDTFAAAFLDGLHQATGQPWRPRWAEDGFMALQP